MRRETWSEALRVDRASAPQVTVGRIAAQMNKSDSLVYKMLEGEHAPSITQLVDFASLTGGHAIMRWLGAMTNHHVAPIPVGRLDDMQYADLLREFSEAVAAYTNATADNQVTPAEAIGVGQQLDDVIVAAHRLKIAINKRASTIPLRPGTLAEAERRAGA
jgi:hypothetical protein